MFTHIIPNPSQFAQDEAKKNHQRAMDAIKRGDAIVVLSYHTTETSDLLYNHGYTQNPSSLIFTKKEKGK